jgi:Xaa-Pro aminopeptidase
MLRAEAEIPCRGRRRARCTVLGLRHAAVPPRELLRAAPVEGKLREVTDPRTGDFMPSRIAPRIQALLLLCAVAASACAPAATPGAAPTVRSEWQVPALPAAAPISADEYAQRRAALAARMRDGVFVAFGSPEPEQDYLPYAQNSNFRYLTGIVEPGAALVVEKRDGQLRELLFVQPRDPAREIWEGTRLGPEGARARTGIAARTNDRLIPVLDSLLAHHGTLYSVTPLPADPARAETLTREQQIITRLRASRPGLQLTDLGMQLQMQRAAKSPAELDLLRRAIYISVLAHREAMRAVQPGMNEFEIQALVEYVFRRHGAERPAYASIVGSGPNSTTLHYRDADRFMRDGEVLLMDVGASYRGYAADITRTVPVNGTFTADQRAIYGIVLDAQKAAERLLRPGATWVQLNQAADRVIAEGLARLGLIDAPDATYRCDSARFGDGLGVCPQYRLFYMHGLGHGIGLDVHDPDPSYFGAFAVGSAITIEPGIYVRADALDFLPDTPENRAMIERLRPAVERFRDIGVRIEDDYFVTADGHERLSAGAPREIAEIEALMREEGIGARTRRPEVVEWYRQTEPR